MSEEQSLTVVSDTDTDFAAELFKTQSWIFQLHPSMREEPSLTVGTDTDTDFVAKLFSLRSGQRQQGERLGADGQTNLLDTILNTYFLCQLRVIYVEVMLGQTLKPEVLNSPSRTNFEAFHQGLFLSLFVILGKCKPFV